MIDRTLRRNIDQFAEGAGGAGSGRRAAVHERPSRHCFLTALTRDDRWPSGRGVEGGEEEESLSPCVGRRGRGLEIAPGRNCVAWG